MKLEHAVNNSASVYSVDHVNIHINYCPPRIKYDNCLCLYAFLRRFNNKLIWYFWLFHISFYPSSSSLASILIEQPFVSTWHVGVMSFRILVLYKYVENSMRPNLVKGSAKKHKQPSLTKINL